MLRYVLMLLMMGLVALSACTTTPEMQREAYAKLVNSKEFEEEYGAVWKGMLAACSEYKIKDQDEDDGEIETDWVYTKSNDMYVEYTVNGLPRRHYLQSRFRMKITAEKLLGRVRVTVLPMEEVEQMNKDGTFDKWIEPKTIDTIRANEMLKKIEIKILSRAP